MISHQLDKLQDLIQQLLPEHLRSHVRVGNMKNGQLLLICDDTSWTTELKFLLPELRDRLREEYQLYQLSGLRAKAEMPIASVKKKKHSPKKLNATVQNTILNSANLLEPGPLRDAMQKLAGVEKED